MTNDGATILKSVMVDNPAAKVLVDLSKTQDEEVGDGTTSVTVLTGELLREAEKLVVEGKIHPMTIIDGWRRSTQVAREQLEGSAMDHGADPARFREDLVNIARTTLSSKLLVHEKGYFAELAVDAVMRIKDSLDLNQIMILKIPGGSLKDSYLEEGFILNKSIGVGQPKRIEKARIMVANTQMDTDKVKIFGTRVRVDSMAKVAEIETAEREKMRTKCQKIIDHGINVFINRQLIYNFPEQIFADAGVMAIEHADFDGIERLASVCGSEIVSTFDHPESTRIGECDVVEEVLIGEEKMIRFAGVKSGGACTIVLRGSSSHLLEEADRSLHDALCVLAETMKETRVVFGGGSAEIAMSTAVEEEARRTPGKKQLAMEAFARALRQLPATVADNAGFDSADLVSRIKAAQAAGDRKAGINIETGEVGDMEALGVVEALKLKLHVLLSAAEAAEMILRVDDIIKCAPRKRGGDHPHM